MFSTDKIRKNTGLYPYYINVFKIRLIFIKKLALTLFRTAIFARAESNKTKFQSPEKK